MNIYIFDFGNQIKIGQSENVKRRLRNIETQSGRDAVQHFSIQASGEYEKLMHKILYEYRGVGEYFTFPYEHAVSILKSLIKFEFAREVKKGSQLFLPLEMPIPDKIVTANMEAKGWTLAELSRELGISENTVTQRLHVKGIDPLFRGAIYPPDTLDRIREAPMGRPPKKTKP